MGTVASIVVYFNYLSKSQSPAPYNIFEPRENPPNSPLSPSGRCEAKSPLLRK